MGVTLASRELTIHFGGHVAVNAVTAEFRAGELTAIVGPNGAGKTTYFNLLSGQLRASAGQVTLHGRDITRSSAPVRADMGIGRGFQLTNLFPRFTVLKTCGSRCKAGRTPASTSWPAGAPARISLSRHTIILRWWVSQHVPTT